MLVVHPKPHSTNRSLLLLQFRQSYNIFTDIEQARSHFSIQVFPNPFAQYLMVQLSSLKDENYQWILIDNFGRTALQARLEANTPTTISRN